jgi:hypothetical protein
MLCLPGPTIGVGTANTIGVEMPEENENTPAYQEYLDRFPEAQRSQVEPIFQDWDKNVSKKFEDIHAQYEPFKPFAEAGWDPDVINAGVGLLDQVNNSPEQVFSALANHLAGQGVDISQLVQGFGGQPPAQQQGNKDDLGEYNLPPEFLQKFENLEKLTQTYAQAFVASEERQKQLSAQQQEQQELQEFGQYLDRVAPESKYPRQFILSYVAQGMPVEQAVEAYTGWYKENVPGGAPTPPRVAPSGGGLPSTGISTDSMNSQDTKNMVVEFLKQANAQG